MKTTHRYAIKRAELEEIQLNYLKTKKNKTITQLFAVASLAQERFNCEILPVVTPEPPTYTELDVHNTKPPTPFNVVAPNLDDPEPNKIDKSLRKSLMKTD